ncbi:16S rRNA (guanine527-N7)-methyltransferase [Maridesulfovibrio ferrireducens]|uniref:Ribosomal RNA small subunit methyltransferase G n=1 Tax=Maridesulfovibrio ferrireducens TaxID=246191 RepID=A0A1G9CE37_9BACT|nr:16S rRNA (guanine(527)-N(7))-methyltransferase RsmG [Maridesulfovibrio ferrireducens]SDK49910.1 16S rRNA (guanine527-N7)-methyltransferase [Maridesulfovibrio ferrireducens]
MAESNVSAADILGASIKAKRRLEDDTRLDSGFIAATDQARVLAYYVNMLVKWNKAMNLVGPKSWDDIFHSLIIDSLHLADFLNDLDLPKNPVTLDLGAGAGLPGLPLRVVWQKGTYHLVESRQKRSIFMRTAMQMMKLPRTEVFQGRAEAIPQEALPADLILSKAFMPWKELMPFVKPMLAETGRLVILSNDSAPASAEIAECGYELESTMEYKAQKKTHYFWSLLPLS